MHSFMMYGWLTGKSKLLSKFYIIYIDIYDQLQRAERMHDKKKSVMSFLDLNTSNTIDNLNVRQSS